MVEGFQFVVVAAAVAVVGVARLHKRQHIVAAAEKIAERIVDSIDDTRCNPVGLLLPLELLQRVDQRLESLGYLLQAIHGAVHLPFLHVVGAEKQPNFLNLLGRLVSCHSRKLHR